MLNDNPVVVEIFILVPCPWW